MSVRPPKDALRAALRAVLGDETADKISDIRPLPDSPPQQRHAIRIAGQPTLTIALAPPSHRRLLRCERERNVSEAAVVSWVWRRSEEASGQEATAVAKVLRFAPALKHSNQTRSNGLMTSFNIFENVDGVPISCLPAPPTAAQRAAIDGQIEEMLGSLAALESGLGQFGLVQDMEEGKHGGLDRQCSWSEAFSGMLEDLLEDGEDAGVVLPYQMMRDKVGRHRHQLDEVRNGCLLLLEGAEDWNVLVASSRAGQVDEALHVVGLQDWSSACFGDPLMLKPFTHHASPALAGPFTTSLSSEGSTDDKGLCLRTESSLSYGIRFSLYEMYLATLTILQNYYGRRDTAGKDELAARRLLQKALGQLDHCVTHE